MSPLRRRPSRPRGDEDGARELRDRTVAMMRRMQRAGAAAVAIEDVLTLLAAEPETKPEPPPPRDPDADPITGCPPTPG